jgi:hypothetical protein
MIEKSEQGLDDVIQKIIVGPRWIAKKDSAMGRGETRIANPSLECGANYATSLGAV